MGRLAIPSMPPIKHHVHKDNETTADVPYSFDAWAARLDINTDTLSRRDEAVLQLAFETLSRRTGARWRVRRVNRMAGLCANMYSKQWDSYWNSLLI